MTSRVRPGDVGAIVSAAALGTVLLLDVLRVWQPSVIFIYGRAGSTPAPQMGAFALVWVLLGVAAAAAVRWVRPAGAFTAAAGFLGLARLVLQAAPGGDVQLYAASVGWVAAMAWAAALVAAAPSRRRVAAGIALGLVGDASLRAATGSVELTWAGGVAGTVAGLVLVGAFAVATSSARGASGWHHGPEPTGGAAWPWLALGPIVVLYGILAGTPARVTVAADVAPGLAAVLIVAALGLGAAWAVSETALPGPVTGVAAAVSVLVGTLLAAPAGGLAAVLGQVILAVGLGGSLGLLARAGGESRPVRGALAVAGSLVLLFVVAFLYYASYDVALGPDNRVFLVACAAIVAVVDVAAGLRARPARRIVSSPALAAGVAVAAALAGIGAWAGSGTGAAPADGLPVRVVLYNLHMGYDTQGRFDVSAQADVIRAEDPDVVVLNEVDRGWFLNGSHDVLQLLADELGMAYVFAPAADEVWGNAILSRFPMNAVTRTRLPQGGVPMRRSVVATVLDLGGGEELGVVGTHLHHVEEDTHVRAAQAAVVAEVAAGLAATGRSVVVAGDLNARPGDDELAPLLAAGFTDALRELGPVATFPSWDPDRHIDHVFVTPDLAATGLAVPRTEASDHLPVAVTLARRS